VTGFRKWRQLHPALGGSWVGHLIALRLRERPPANAGGLFSYEPSFLFVVLYSAIRLQEEPHDSSKAMSRITDRVRVVDRNPIVPCR
jgi:hypothetical protein